MDHDTSKEWSEHAQLIGHITIQMNQLQSFVKDMFWMASGTGYDMAHAIFFSIKSDAGQRDMTLAAVRERLKEPDDQELTARIKSKFSEINNLSGERNAFIHSIWAMEMPDKKITVAPRIPPHPRLKPEQIKEQAEELITKLNDLLMPMIELVQDFSDSSSMKKFREHRAKGRK